MPHDPADTIDEINNFLRDKYEDEIRRNDATGKTSLDIDYNDLQKYNPELADELIENPAKIIHATETALNGIGFLDNEHTPRIHNLPERHQTSIRDLRSKHLGKLTSIKGIIKRASEVRPEIQSATFECTSCGDTQTKEQDSSQLTSPYECSCGSKKFEPIDKEMQDLQIVTIEENPQDIEGSEQPEDLPITLRNELVDPKFQRQIVPGNEVVITGILRERAKKKNSKQYDIYMEGIHVDPINREFEQIEITPEEEQRIKELGEEDDIFKRITESIAPSIYGHQRIKEAVALQLFGGVRKSRPDGTTTRGDMHILLIGEPGTGKSQILQFTGEIAPKGKYVVGKSATGAGITATAVKEEMSDGWALEAGALVLANKGIATVDEIDKMSDQDRSSLHEAMEQQTITVNKANIQATLQCQTSILAAGNPKFGRFDPFDPVATQIDIGETLLSRFDLIFPIQDTPDEEKDAKLADHILDMHTAPEEHRGTIEADLLQKYIAHARKNIEPELDDEARERIKSFYIQMRQSGQNLEEEGASVPITARQVEGLIRLSEASARTRLSETVELEDADRAIDILTHCLKQVGMDPETGELDIDRIESGISTTSRNRIQKIKRIVKSKNERGSGGVPVEDVIEEAQNQDIPEDKAEQAINKLKNQGDLYEPRNGHVQPL